MTLPFFFKENLDLHSQTFTLEEETSKHIVQVLRMKTGEFIQLTDGKGGLVRAEIIRDHKKNCEVRVLNAEKRPQSPGKISIAISLLKNGSRFEWFLEKTTEIGIHEIIPLICERTIKQQFRYDRMKSICVSAMLQSQQVWLPVLHEPTPVASVLKDASYEQRFIAHCADNQKKNLSATLSDRAQSKIILIGPEGDFSEEEIESAISNRFIPVSLGETRLRTETAGIAAAAIMAIR